jgi:purine-cytosine permease-like protein
VTGTWNNSQGGSGSVALLVGAFVCTLRSFDKFCDFIATLGRIANTIPPTYSYGIGFQLLGMVGRYFAEVLRIVRNTFRVIIYRVYTLTGKKYLAEVLPTFLALMGYWVAA